MDVTIADVIAALRGRGCNGYAELLETCTNLVPISPEEVSAFAREATRICLALADVEARAEWTEYHAPVKEER